MHPRLPSPISSKTTGGRNAVRLAQRPITTAVRCRSSADLLAEIAAEQMLLEDDAVAIVERDLARLVGIGEPLGFRQRLAAADEAGPRSALPLLGDGPAAFRRMDSIDVTSQHDPSRLPFPGPPTRRRRAAFPGCTAGGGPLCCKKNGIGVHRSREVCGWQTRDRETLPNRTRGLRARVRGSPTCRISTTWSRTRTARMRSTNL